MPFSNILLLQIIDRKKVQRWLTSLIPKLSRAAIKDGELEINIAFTYQGFSALGLHSLMTTRFSREFEEGMGEESRSRLLGDVNKHTRDSTVDQWDWSDIESKHKVHLILLIYGLEEHLVENHCSDLKLCYSDNGLTEIKKLTTLRLEEKREHFGFRDGISQPFIKEFASQNKATNETDNRNNIIALGEFLLGYPNQYGKITEVPCVRSATGEEWEFGRNGTYLVMRQLAQDVKGFWDFMEKSSRNADGTTNMEAYVALAAKMVGRWPNGAPLVCSPDFDDPRFADENEFLFDFKTKENFLKCPFGAHIARVNPRDSLDTDSQTSFEISNHHRILRRGRSYGRPFITNMKPEELFGKANQDNEERGLHFICLNANISRQFEFVQSTWINNNKFQGLYNDTDPISSTSVSDFTISQRPISRYLRDIPPFVTVRGGGYFFMPSHTALRFLSQC